LALTAIGVQVRADLILSKVAQHCFLEAQFRAAERNVSGTTGRLK
jgi:hypothetical protein